MLTILKILIQFIKDLIFQISFKVILKKKKNLLSLCVFEVIKPLGVLLIFFFFNLENIKELFA